MQNPLILTTPAELKMLLAETLKDHLAELTAKLQPRIEDPNETLTKPEAKKLLGIKGDSTLWLWIRTGKIPAPIKKGRRCLWKRSEIEKSLTNSKL